MRKSIFCAAVAATAMAMAVPGQAATANTNVNTSAPAKVQLARYYYHHYRGPYVRFGWGSYAYQPRYRHRRYTCWRVRVYRHGHRYWARRCGWRYW
jgi:hypothetical protein